MTQETNPQGTGPRRLERTRSGRMLVGVCSGIGAYAGIDANVVRLLAVLLVFVGGISVALYAAGWLLMPEEGEERSVAQRLLKQ